ncbi:Eukaryotic translation initiation factor 2 alpha kinase 4 [Cladochytrium tenue]|nr:Eukaryotic translation initiation factor 2 alpha kinase 4 [Cladochytrium tenue]
MTTARTSTATGAVGVFLTTVAAAIAAVAAYRLARMRRRARILRRINPQLPIHTSFFSRYSPWVLFSPLPRTWLAAFPGGWELRDPIGPFRNGIDKDYDDGTGGQPSKPAKAFAVVTPDETWLYLADPLLVHKLLVTSHRDFPRPTHYYGSLIGFHNVLVDDGDAWRRQRRLVAPQFSDRNNTFVLAETIRLAKSMFHHWEAVASASTTSGQTAFKVPITYDMSRFALKVICSAGFGFEVDWPDRIPPGRKHSIEDCMLKSARYRLFLKTVPAWLWPLFSKSAARAIEFVSEFDAHVEAAVADARNPDVLANGSLLDALIKASSSPGASEEGALSEEELYGNILLIFQAGYVTTAPTLNGAILLLASDPAAQDRLHAEAAAVFGSLEDASCASLKDLQRLPFALAVMNETLRLHPVITNTAAWTADSAPVQSLGNLALPESTHIYIAIRSLHRDPDNWGPDAHLFRPTRWLPGSPKDDSAADLVDSPETTLLSPKVGAFIPFSEGPRACLGRRFSQTEFVALLSILALRYRWSLPESADPAHVLDGSVGVFLLAPSMQNVVMQPR